MNEEILKIEVKNAVKKAFAAKNTIPKGKLLASGDEQGVRKMIAEYFYYDKGSLPELMPDGENVWKIKSPSGKIPEPFRVVKDKGRFKFIQI
jgi:hypothetical protein